MSLKANDLPSGGKTTLTYTVTNKNLPTPNAAEDLSVEVQANGMDCSGECELQDTLGPQQSRTVTVTLTAGNVDPGETQKIDVRVIATIDGQPGSASRVITVRGEDKPQTVRQVSGRVKDQDGKAVSGALVGLRDSQNHQYQTTTNGDGGYSFTSSESKPITAGALFVGAAKEGYITSSVNAQGRTDKSVTVPLTIKSTAPPSKSASPSPSASVSALPTDEVTDEETAATDETAAADTTKTSGEDEGSGSMLFIILGILLVAAGIGAIVLVLMRRKSGEDPDAKDDVDGPVAPLGGGRYGGADETRLAGAPMGGRASDATMIAPRSGAPSMADAPTMIHQAAPAVDEFPDPYGAPMPQGGGYNAPGGWGTAGAAAGAAGAYGAATQYGGAPVPAQSGGYDDAYGGYDQADGYDQAAPYAAPQPGYDEPTGMYRPEPTGGYPPPEPGYADPAGYGAEPAYGQPGYAQGADDYAGGAYPGGNGYQGGAYGAPTEPAEQGGGYGSWDGQGGPSAGGGTHGGAGGGTYGAQGGQPYGGGNYGAPAGGGYGAPEPADGYGADQGGYDPRATYGRPEGYDQARGQQPPPGGGYPEQGGYGAEQQGGYYGAEQQGGRHGGQPRQQPPPEGARPGQRRPLDWMDD